MSREGKLAKNTFILAIGTFLPKLASFITLPILTGYLTQEEYGTYDLISVLVSLVLPAATLQIQTAAFRYLIDVRHDENEKKKIITNIFTFIIPTSILVLTIMYFCLYSLPVEIRVLICIYFFVDGLVNASRQVIRGLANNLEYSISAIISSFGKMLFAILCVCFLEMGLIGAIIALFCADLFSLFYLMFKAKIYSYLEVNLISICEIKKLLKYSWPMVPNSMSMWIMRVSDRFVVTFFMGVSSNAIYSVANKIPQLLTVAQSTFTMAWQENATMYSKDDDADTYYSSMFQTMYDLMAGFMGVLIAVTPILFILLIRGNYKEAYFQIPILFLGMFFYSMSSYLGGIYVAFKATKSVGVTTMVAAACNFMVDIILIKFIGLYAASGSTAISYIILFLFRMFDVRKLVKLTYNYKRMLIIFMIMLFECFLCFKQMVILNLFNIVFGCVVFFMLNQSFVRAVWIRVVKKITGIDKCRNS